MFFIYFQLFTLSTTNLIMLELLIVCLAGVSLSFVIVIVLIFRLIRAKFPVKVNCWFCDKPFSVPFGNRNCWDCPSCEQYNGFTNDGDYNKAIPSQWTTELNHPISCKKQEFIQSSNGLCHACNERQLLKMQQLTAFQPFVKSNYIQEVNDYKDHLEKIYHLCYKCNLHVHQELERQDLALKLRHSQYLSNDSLVSSTSSSRSSSSTSQSSSSDDDPVKTAVNQWCSHITGLLSCMLAVFLLFVHLGQTQSAFVYKMQLPTWALLMLGWLTTKNCGIAFSGLFLCLTSKFLWVGHKSLYPSDVICCFIWFLQSLLSVLITFGMVSSIFLMTLQSAIPLVSLISIFLNIFSSGCSRSTVSNKMLSRISYSRSSNPSSLQSSFSSQPAESVQGFNCNDSLSSWHSSQMKRPSLSKFDSASSYFQSAFHKPFLHGPPSSSFPLTKDIWSPLSIKTNFRSFPLGHGSNLPSFKSLSQASVNGDFTSGHFSSKSLFSQPLSRSASFFSLDNKSHLSPYFQRGPSSLNGSFTSLRDVRKKNTPSSLADNILGIKMNKISLGSSLSPSRKSISDANLSCKSMPRSSSPVLTRGEIAPARLSTVKQGSDLLSPNRTFSDHDSLFSSSNYQHCLSDTASVHSDNFSVRSNSSRKSRPFGFGENSFSSLNNVTSDTNQTEINDTDDSKGSSSDATKHTSETLSKNTGYRPSISTLLIISLCINILLITVNMERIPLPDRISTYLSIIVISFKHFISSLSISSWFQTCITNVLSIFTV